MHGWARERILKHGAYRNLRFTSFKILMRADFIEVCSCLKVYKVTVVMLLPLHLRIVTRLENLDL